LQPVYERLLRERLEKLTVELAEKQTEKRKQHHGREETGVQLYAVQQQLAKLQMQLEASHEDFNEIHRLRGQAEAEAAQANQIFEERTAEMSALKQRGTSSPLPLLYLSSSVHISK